MGDKHQRRFDLREAFTKVLPTNQIKTGEMKMLDYIEEYLGDSYRKKIAYRLVDRCTYRGKDKYIPIGIFGYISQMSKKNARCPVTGRFLK